MSALLHLTKCLSIRIYIIRKRRNTLISLLLTNTQISGNHIVLMLTNSGCKLKKFVDVKLFYTRPLQRIPSNWNSTTDITYKYYRLSLKDPSHHTTPSMDSGCGIGYSLHRNKFRIEQKMQLLISMVALAFPRAGYVVAYSKYTRVYAYQATQKYFDPYC